MKIYKKAILPRGFKANGLACGIKRSGKLDLALIYSEIPAKAACRFTANNIQAAPIILNKKYLKDSNYFRALIVNSGNANSFTGIQGIKDASETTRYLAGVLGLKKENILVASTGIIGKRLPLVKMKAKIPELVWGLTAEGIDQAKRAILTTDTFVKEISVRFNIGKQIITLCGMAKGAGMISPHLATMLGFIFTDARITQRALDQALDIAAGNSFHCITVDGCMSTNDTLIALANACAGNALIDIKRNFSLFLNALNKVCLQLAKMIVQDAEGATKFIQIKVSGARNKDEAKRIALGIANSNLFKTAMYGQNPNFGRIVSAVGASGAEVREKDLKIRVSPLAKKEITVNVSVGRGQAGVTVYTSDLTPEYVKINAEYN